jgi:hypothetical protein
MHDDHPMPVLEYSQIDDLVFIGTNACCQMHFDQMLLAKGITVDISLEGEMIDKPVGVETYLWLPTPDHQPPTTHNADMGIAAIRLARAQGRKMYIHCKNGHGRGPTLYAAYLIDTGTPMDEAIARIAEKRPSIHLEDSQRSFLAAYRSLEGR